MKIIISFFFFSLVLTNTVYASVGESDTECIQMLEASDRSNPKANMEQIKQDKKPSTSSAVRG